jgi:hypothetical protein
MTVEKAVKQALGWFDGGEFKAVLARRVALATESQSTERDEILKRYFEEESRAAGNGL